MVILLSNGVEHVERRATHNIGFCAIGAYITKHQLFSTINFSSSSTVRNSTTTLNINKQYKSTAVRA